MPYIYTHTNVKNSVLFYVGIGKSDNGKYFRAFSRGGRGKFWCDYIKNEDFLVAIIDYNVTWEEACTREKELIEFYGRRDLKRGSLVNLTDGGDGACGYQYNKEELERLSINASGGNNPRAKPCICRETGEEFSCLKEACEVRNLTYSQQKSALQKGLCTSKFYYKDCYFDMEDKRVIDLETRKVYSTLCKACTELSLRHSSEYYRIINNSKNKRFEYYKAYKEAKKQEK